MAEGDVGTGSKLSDALTKKLGPLPGYVWIGLAVGGFVVYRKLHGSSSSASGPATPAPGSDQGITAGGLDSGGFGVGGGGGAPTDNAGAGAGFFFDPTPINDLTDALNGLLSAQTNPQSNGSGLQYTNPMQSGLFNPGSPVPIGAVYNIPPGQLATGHDVYGNPVVAGSVIANYASPTAGGTGFGPGEHVDPNVNLQPYAIAPTPAHTAAIAPSAGGGGGGGRGGVLAV